MIQQKITEKLDAIAKLDTIDLSEWPRLWCELNRWNLPKELFGEERLFPNRIGGKEHHEFIRPIMNYIVDTVGMKKCNREWNKDRMTDEEHESFWRGNKLKP